MINSSMQYSNFHMQLWSNTNKINNNNELPAWLFNHKLITVKYHIVVRWESWQDEVYPCSVQSPGTSSPRSSSFRLEYIYRYKLQFVLFSVATFADRGTLLCSTRNSMKFISKLIFLVVQRYRVTNCYQYHWTT